MKAIRPNQFSDPIFTDDKEIVLRAKRLGWEVLEKRTMMKKLRETLLRQGSQSVGTAARASQPASKKKGSGGNHEDQTTKKSKDGEGC